MYSIWHTSHCGSTYLATLLSKSIPTYAEPDWTFTDELKTDSEVLIKFPSSQNYKVTEVSGKKIFLYRTLYSDLMTLGQKPIPELLVRNTINHAYSEKIKDNILNSIRHHHMRACIWLNIVKYMNDAKDIIFVNSEDLFNNPQLVCKRICAFFGIKYISVEANYNVKKAGFNRQNTPIDISKAETKEEFVEPYLKYNSTLYKWIDEYLQNKPRIKHLGY